MLKRTFDLTLALVLAIVFLPLALLIFLFIIVLMGKPALFVQKRPVCDFVLHFKMGLEKWPDNVLDVLCPFLFADSANRVAAICSIHL